MNISSVFIKRPIAMILLSVALAAAGIFAYGFIPVAALPEVKAMADNPKVSGSQVADAFLSVLKSPLKLPATPNGG